MIGLLIIAIVALGRRAHDNVQGRHRRARRRSQRAADLMQDAFGANWGPHMHPLKWFATHSVCATCDRVFSTVDRNDACPRGESSCHTFSRTIHELISHAVARKYRAVPPPIQLPTRLPKGQSSVLCVHQPPLESEWVLVDRDVVDEQVPNRHRPLPDQIHAPLVAPPAADLLQVGRLLAVDDEETPGEPLEAPQEVLAAIERLPSPEDPESGELDLPDVPFGEMPLVDLSFPDVPALPPQYQMAMSPAAHAL